MLHKYKENAERGTNDRHSLDKRPRAAPQSCPRRGRQPRRGPLHGSAMKMMGHDVQFAINGLAALAIAKAFQPDVILLDIGLPDFGGDNIARQLKYAPGFERTRIIAITGLRISEVRERALQAGCEAVYAKPLAPTALEDLLEKSSEGMASPRSSSARSP